MKVKHDSTIQQRRRVRTRKKIFGTAERPRVSVFRSNKHVYVQVINDEIGKTLVSANDKQKSLTKDIKGKSKVETAKVIGQQIAKEMKSAKISKAVFDRGHYRYHGRVRMIAEVLREGGIEL